MSTTEREDAIDHLRHNHYAVYLAKMTKKIDELRQNRSLTSQEKTFQLQSYNESLKDALLAKLRRLNIQINKAPANMANPRLYLEAKKQALLEDLRKVMEMYRSIRTTFGLSAENPTPEDTTTATNPTNPG